MSDLKKIIEEIVEAFNRRDLDAIASHVTDDFSWVDSEGVSVTQGKADFLQAVKSYYDDNPNVKNASSEIIVLGNLATHTETFTDHADGSVQSYLWVYNFNDAGKLTKQWGFTPTS